MNLLEATKNHNEFINDKANNVLLQQAVALKILAAVDDASIVFVSEEMNKIVSILRRNKCGLV